MNRDQKAAVIDEVAGQLRDADASFRIVKNTLTERAADQAGAEGLKAYLEGPTAMTFVRGDAAAAAKALADFRRASGLLEFKGGWMNGEALSPEQMDAIARLPTREVLYGRLVGMVASPLTGLASALNGLVGGLARQLSQIAEQGLVGGDAPAPAPAAESPPAEEGEPPEEGGADPDAQPASEPAETGPDPDPAPSEGDDTTETPKEDQ